MHNNERHAIYRAMQIFQQVSLTEQFQNQPLEGAGVFSFLECELTVYVLPTLVWRHVIVGETPANGAQVDVSRFWSSFLYFLKNLSSKFQPTTFLTFRAFFTDDLGHHFQIALDQIFPGRIEVAAAVFSLQIRISNENLLKNPAIVVLIAKFRGNS